MPIGIPKVPYRLPGKRSGEWVDIFNRLYRERMLFFCRVLVVVITNQIVGVIIYLNTEIVGVLLYLNTETGASKDIVLHINSLGGSVNCGLALYDTINYIDPDVLTLCIGTAASMASFILAAGTRDKRVVLPHSRIMIHQPEGGSQGQASEILSEAEEVLRIRRQIEKIYAERTGQPVERISQDINRDQFMSALEARNYGLIDHVSKPFKK
jgi:ATP-dependent Clp protease protease subunit